jgi:4-diphosphocytidyl-2-C-methyl-D-erythritol kinase
MSGSGATCFGLYADEADRDAAAAGISAAHPDWWLLQTRPL